MDSKQFSELVAKIKIGKHLSDSIYLHKDAFEELSPTLQQFIPAVAKALKIEDNDWHLVKLNKKDFRLSLLSYPDFYTESYPALKQSVTVDLNKLSHRITQYQENDNPPILHRKELMILPKNKYYHSFIQLTEEGENAGLYENTRIIGFKQSWENLIRRNGYELVDGRLFRSAMLDDTDEHVIDRHKTAIIRHSLSAPMKYLAKRGFLEGDYSIFDYGCGRGDDMRELLAHGLNVFGWDPNFYPDGEKTNTDIVNIGFVLNVIEDQHERLEALINAWELADKLLIVSVMLGTEDFINQFKPYKDGVITSRNTFQKYYLQSEIKSYIERSLDEIPIAVAPGIFLIFKDKEEEQNYLQNRYHRHVSWKQLTTVEPREKAPKIKEDKAKLLITQHQELFDAFWEKTLDLGRVPANDEFEHSDKIRELVGSHIKAHRLLCKINGKEVYELGCKQRKEDLKLYFAISCFEKRKPYTKQSERLKRDIKAFFGDYKTALTQAQDALFQIADIELIEQACIEAHQTLSTSVLNEGHSLILHKSYVDDLPQILRIYVEAALQMYGDLEEIDLIKIHITSGKLTLTAYDDFAKSVPFLKERIKIKMAEQKIDFFDYVNLSKQPPLLNKSLYMPIDSLDLEKQVSFDKRLAKLLGIPIDKEVIMSRAEFERGLAEEGKRILGFQFCSV